MSYNITSIKTKSVDLRLPLTFDFQSWLATLPTRDKNGYENYGVRFCKEGKSSVQVTLSNTPATWELDFDRSSHTLSGIVTSENTLQVTAFDLRSDSSGYVYSNVFLPLFEAFKGNLDAIIVWESGDTISRVTIKEGVVSEDEIA